MSTANLIGEKFGRLTVIGTKYDKNNKNPMKLRVRCECGTEKEVYESNIRRTYSCGCLQNEVRKRQALALRKLGYTWKYKGKTYYTKEMVDILLEKFEGKIKESTIRAYLMSKGLKYVLRLADDYKEKRGARGFVVKDYMGFYSVKEMVKASGITRQGFYYKIKMGYTPYRENNKILWKK